MADKDLGKRAFESLAKASLSVRYTRLINEQASSRAGPASRDAPPSGRVSVDDGASRPKLRTVVQPCPPVSMKGKLGLHQDTIRLLQSPSWLLEKQRNPSGKNERDAAGERLVAAGSSLLDLCRFVEILLNKVAQDKFTRALDEAAQSLGEKLTAIWDVLYLAVKHLENDCQRSGAFVRLASAEVLNLGFELADGQSYADVWAQKFVSQLELLSAGIADAYELLPQLSTRTKQRSKSIKNALSANVSIARRSEGDKKIAIFSESSDSGTELVREIKVICDAVNALIQKLSESDQDISETIGMFKLCAARLNFMLSLPCSTKKWELELHRAHFVFRQAARGLSMAQEMATHGKASSSRNLPYGRMADYIADRFEDTVANVLKKADSGYARHNFIIRKQSGRIPSQAVLRLPLNAPLSENATTGQRSTKPRLTLPKMRQDTDSAHQTTRTPVSVAAVRPPLSNTVVVLKRDNLGVRSEDFANTPTNKQPDVNTGPGSIRQKRLTREYAPVPGKSIVRAATMSVHWDELDTLSRRQ